MIHFGWAERHPVRVNTEPWLQSGEVLDEPRSSWAKAQVKNSTGDRFASLYIHSRFYRAARHALILFQIRRA
jgi:hypothetical protein